MKFKIVEYIVKGRYFYRCHHCLWDGPGPASHESETLVSCRACFNTRKTAEFLLCPVK